MFVDTLYRLMKERGITQKKLVEDVKIGKNQIKYWRDNGNIPNGETLKKLADYFGVSVGYLLDMEDDDAEFVASLPEIKPLQELPAEIEAVNVFLRPLGHMITRVNDQYYMDECGELSEDELNAMLNSVSMYIKNWVDVTVAEKKNELFDFFKKKGEN